MSLFNLTSGCFFTKLVYLEMFDGSIKGVSVGFSGQSDVLGSHIKTNDYYLIYYYCNNWAWMLKNRI